jgi:riboflavin kinase/FMN adenylyltransferase
MDATLVLPFTAELSLLSPEEFVGRVLVEQLRAQAVLVGQNFRFGHKGAGNVAMLADFGKKYGFEVEIVPPVMVRGQMVSSTAVRNAIREGRVSDAVRFLGRPFVLIGEIESGTGTGRRLVVPTLNLRPQQELLPPRGVFVTETWLTDAEAVESPGRIYRSVTNVGMRPTFDGQRLTIESHLFDYSGELISGAMGVSFWRRLREEKKFASPEELRAQIACDMRAAQSFFRRLDRARQFHRSEVAARAILRRSG